jgi:hypothetical protein
VGLGLGHPLDLADSAGDRFVRSDWSPVTPTIRLWRHFEREAIEWGTFDYQCGCDPEATGLSYFQIDLDEGLIPVLHLCGDSTPVYQLEGTAVNLKSYLPSGWFDSRGILRLLPAGLRVRRHSGVPDDEEWSAVFPEMPVIPADFFRHVFTCPERPDERIRAIISDRPLPGISGTILSSPRAEASEGDLRYEFSAAEAGAPHARRDEEAAVVLRFEQATGSLWPLMPPPLNWAVLDMYGRLYIARGYPIYQKAHSLADAEANPGSVFSISMDSGPHIWSHFQEPFSDSH